MKKSILSILFISAFCVSFAATITARFTGNWSNSLTWTGGVTPGDNDIVIIPTGRNVTIDINTPTYVKMTVEVSGTLTIDNGAKLDMDEFGLVRILNGATLDAINGGSKIRIGGNNVFVGPRTESGPFALGIGGFGGLPIQLLNFTAITKNNTVDLSWTTATETNNNYFSVQRSANGFNYETIATVKGAGNSSTKLTYSYIDESPLTGTSYYRLMQTDYDNKFETFTGVAVTFDRASNNLNVYPNPTTNNNINLTFSATENVNVVINIMDISGRELFNKAVIASEGDNNVQLDASLAKGTYFLRVLNNQKSTVKTLIIE